VHPVFRSAELDERFLTQGFVAAPFLSVDEVSALRESLGEGVLVGDRGFRDTAALPLDFEAKQRIHALLSAAFADGADELLEAYAPVMSSVITKWPGEDSQKELHRDFRLVDERRYRSVTIWVPLVDVDEHNGALCVLPGSHLVDAGPRSVPRAPGQVLPPLDCTDLVTVPMRAGDAVLFDMAVAHGSALNRSDRPRPAAAVAYAPAEARLSLDFCHPDDRVEEFEVAHPDVFRQLDWAAPPPGARSLGEVSTAARGCSVEEFVERSRAIARSNGGAPERGAEQWHRGVRGRRR